MVSKVELDGSTLHLGDCLEVLRTLPDCSVDAVVTDPPYGLSFMGKRWDYDVPAVEIWAECLRVLKHGGHLLAFAGTRTQHRMAVRIEDAGFEIRDMIAWVYGSGFPKSLDVSKAIDKAAGAEREVVHTRKRSQVASEGWDRPWKQEAMKQAGGTVAEYTITAPATEAARQWHGWGTALKPAMEPITVARKPLAGTVAANVLEHGTGALNVDGCRVKGRERTDYGLANSTRSAGNTYGEPSASADFDASKGRWPANLIHDGSEEVVGLFPQTGPSPKQYEKTKAGWLAPGSLHIKSELQSREYGDSGSAARFFYTAKAAKSDRDDGLDLRLPARRQGARPGSPDETGKFPDHDHRERTGNFHPTVKPTDLMRYLCRLVTPPGGTVLDPFMGSGSTGRAALLEGFRFIGIEREAQYLEIARARVQSATPALWRQS
jgi:site-specific DNA-methyltransferase (adenine-specific)